ncbi:hypothetical protein KNT87_gp235 [Erwinia phage Cronus]|uniref:Uncharacterized protein n=1 Tax=Erwinia phage Cronus TaxID=2163633 RepID=A0A2S1GLT9_9CAUD|nr:hypothetical protein KNT87_gp235 [Erwinia phage Cronus]AWD90334.1 hypothetical protein [Erwinia phage Cronus]
MRLQPILIDVVMSPEAQTLVECWTASQYEPNNFDYMVQYAKAKVALWKKLGLENTMSDAFNFQDGVLAITYYEVKNAN